MRRSSLLTQGLALTLVVTCAGDAPAQERLDPAKLHPLTVPVRDAGVFDWNTKRWVSGQFWYRDPGNTSNQTTSLSNAVEWTVCP